MALKDTVQDQRLHVLHRVEAIGSFAAACREAGISRSLVHQLRKRYALCGPDGLHPRRTKARPGRPPAVAAHVERAVIAMALSGPIWVPNRLSLELACRGIEIAPRTVYRTLRRIGLRTRRERGSSHDRLDSLFALDQNRRKALDWTPQ